MKKPIFIIAIIAATIFTSCQSSATKVENAEEDLQTAKVQVQVKKDNLRLCKERQESIDQFKIESKEKIAYYDSKIVELKAKIADKKTKGNAIYESRLALIEQKNNELKNKLEEYSDDTSDNWEIFKSEIKHDMENLDKALKDIFIVNEK